MSKSKSKKHLEKRRGFQVHPILRAIEELWADQAQMMACIEACIEVHLEVHLEAVEQKDPVANPPSREDAEAFRLAMVKTKRREIKGSAMPRKRQCTDEDSDSDSEDSSDEDRNTEPLIFDKKRCRISS